MRYETSNLRDREELPMNSVYTSRVSKLSLCGGLFSARFAHLAGRYTYSWCNLFGKSIATAETANPIRLSIRLRSGLFLFPFLNQLVIEYLHVLRILCAVSHLKSSNSSNVSGRHLRDHSRDLPALWPLKLEFIEVFFGGRQPVNG